MKVIRGKKGFTMVELLAVIIILGMVTAISVMAIQGVLKNAKERYYVSQEETINAAARNYMEKNKQYLPKVNGQRTTVTLNDLIKSKYISDVVDYNKKKCHIENSYVQVFKLRDNYIYDTYLECDEYKTQLADLNGVFENFNVTFSGGINDAKVTISLQESKYGLSSYQYKIIDVDINKVIFTSEEFDAKQTTDLITRKISIADYTPAKLKVTLVATNVGGYSHTVYNIHDYIDDGSKVSCGTNNGTTTWTNTDKIITINCLDDANRIGCARDTFSKTFTGNTKYDVITITDKVGNKRNCPVPVYIDKSCPTVTTSTVSAANDNLTFNLTDNFSLAGYAVTTSADTPTSWTNIPGTEPTSFNKTVTVSDGTFFVHVKDSAGNTAYKEQKVVTMGTPTVTLKSNGSVISKANDTWKNKDVTMYLSVDSKVEIAKWQYSHDGTNWSDDFTNNSSGWQANYSNGKRDANFTISWDGGWNFYVRAVDKNGVTSPKSEKFWIGRDTVPPTCKIKLIGNRPFPSNFYDYYDGPITGEINGTDATSGIEYYDIQFNGTDVSLDDYYTVDDHQDDQLWLYFGERSHDPNQFYWTRQRLKNKRFTTAFPGNSGFGLFYAYTIDKADNMCGTIEYVEQDGAAPYAPSYYKAENVSNATILETKCTGDCREQYYHRGDHEMYYKVKCPCGKTCEIKLWSSGCRDRPGDPLVIHGDMMPWPTLVTVSDIDKKVSGTCGQTIVKTGEYYCVDILGKVGNTGKVKIEWVS